MKSSYVGKDGYKIVKMVDSRICFETGSKEIARRDLFYVTRSLIAYTYTSAKIVYFVSDSNGNEYGQFPTRTLALKRFQEIRRTIKKVK